MVIAIISLIFSLKETFMVCSVASDSELSVICNAEVEVVSVVVEYVTSLRCVGV